MKVKVPHYFDTFNCIAGDCESTCCANWEVVIDKESLEKYKAEKGPYKEILHNRIVKNDENEDIFLLNGDRCSFLNQDNTCDMYINLGKTSLCYTCTQYPRFIETFLDLKEMGLSLSCPEAARIILKEDAPLRLKESFNTENGIAPSDDSEETMLYSFQIARDTIFKIINATTLTSKEKITIILSFATDIQTKIDLGDTNEIPEVLEEYADFNKENFIATVLEYLNEDNLYKPLNNEAQLNQLINYFEIFKDLKQLNSEDSLNIEKIIGFIKTNKETYLEKRKEFDIYYKDQLYKFKNIFTYFIYRYFLKGFFDYDIIARTKFAVISTLIIKELAIITWLENKTLDHSKLVQLCYTYSKNIEHLEENIDTLEEIFENEDIFIPFYILQLINYSNQ